LFQSSNVKSTPVRVDAEVELDKDVLQRRGKRDDWRCLGLGNIAEGTGDESVDRLKDEVIDRVQETITRAHRNPQYRSALRTMLEIIRKYATKLSLAASSVPRDSPIRIKPPRQTCYTFIGRPQKYSWSAVHRGHHSILFSPLLGLLLFIYLWLHTT
jgi:hypothetical protein